MNDNSDSSARLSLPYKRWLALTALLAAEFIAITCRYDSSGVPESRPWYVLVHRAGAVPRAGLAISLAVLLMAGPTWYRELARSSRLLARTRSFFPLILGNLLAFLCFFVLSAPIVEGERSPDPADWFLFAGWVASGTAITWFWALAVMRWDLWARLLRQSWGSMIAGSVIGLGAYTAGQLASNGWLPLSRATLELVNGMLGLIFSDVVYTSGKITIGTSRFNAEIAPQCAGYEGMGLVAVLIAIALWALRRDFRFPRAYALLPLSVALMWLANGFRITALIALGTWGYSKFAVGGFHSLAGWVFLLAVGLGVIAFAHRMPFFSMASAAPPNDRAALDAAYLVPAMTLIATSMITATMSPGMDRYYAARVILVAIAFLVYRRYYTELHLKWSWEAVAIGCGVFAFWMALEPRGTPAATQSPILSGLESLPQGWAITWLIFKVLGSVIMVPLAEELAFRGYLTRRLISSDFQSVPPGRLTWISFVVSSLVFGVLHGRWFAGTLAGMAFALAYRRRGELCDAVLAHGVTNALIAVTVLAARDWSLWA
jgi:exosortase E/protease (VPEID-CTERM system)